MATVSSSSEERERYRALEEEISSSASEDSYTSKSLVELSSYIQVNPLNPKSEKNLKQSDFIQNKFAVSPGRGFQASKSTGKRWISIQAHNHQALNDWIDQVNYRDSLVITTTIKPQNGVGWDEVINVEDITQYSSSEWTASFGLPNNSSVLQTVNNGDTIKLIYRNDAFNSTTSAYNYQTNNGAFYVDLKVTFASGHIEYFTSQNYANDNGAILCPVGELYAQQFDYLYSWGTSAANKIQSVNKCDNKLPTVDFYSTGINQIISPSAISDYSILTRYKPIHNPSGTLLEVGMYSEFTTPTGAGAQPPFLMPLTPISYSWGDQVAAVYGLNGIVTPDQNQTGKQVFARIDVLFQHNNSLYIDNINNKDKNWFQTNYTTSSLSPGHWFDDTQIGSSFATSYDSVIQSITSVPQEQYLFTHTYYYSENIPNCSSSANPRAYDVCLSVGDPLYYLTTNKDCNGVTIPTTDLPGGANYNSGAVTFNDGQCCTPCTLQLFAFNNIASYNTNDGLVIWTANNSGNPFNSGSLYTVSVTNAAGVAYGAVAPAGGTVFTDATCDTNITSGTANLVSCDSSVKIVPGMQISGTGIPAGTRVGLITVGVTSINATQFELIDISGLPVSATAANTNVTLTFSTGGTGNHGGLAPNDSSNPYYQICITDEDDCEECSTFTISQDTTPPLGCTDSTAVNYDSAAVSDDGSCILCNSTTGILEDPGGTNTTPLFDSTSASGSAATWGSTSHNSDGTLAVSASPIAAAIPYMTWDANSKFELLLYKTINQGEASTAAGATQIGSTINAGTLAAVSVAANNFTGLAYGYYTIRVRYVDTNSVSTLENCFTEFFGIVQAEVCDNPLNSSYNNTPSDVVLRLPNSSLCVFTPNCCQIDPIAEDTVKFGSTCQPVLASEVECDPYRSVVVNWYYSATGSSYSLLGSYNIGFVSIPTAIYANLNNNPSSGANWYTASGYYKAEIVCTYNVPGFPANICTEEDISIFTLPATGCTDSTSLNYDPLAVCPGPCAYASWDCDLLTGSCTDPWTGSFPYTPGPYNCLNGPGCCNNNCTPPPRLGCTDSCAINYDVTADTDDGSCLYSGCTDYAATNQYQNCCNGNYYAPAQITVTDNSCCVIPCSPLNNISLAITDSTGTCTVFNSDGTVSATVTINNAAPTWTWGIFDNSGTTLIYADPTTYSGSTTSATYSLLNSGNYIAIIEDSLGCTTTEYFTIGSTSPQVGCTDPNADNYDPLAICDCCCQTCGCLDPNASNYNPNANCPDQCDYPDPPPSPCIPESLVDDQIKVKTCLALKGTKWLKDYSIGRADDCTIMNKWKLILIDYLLAQDKLSCLFNCADIQTDINAVVDCDSLWRTGGPSTGLNHSPAHVHASVITPGEGTTVTAYDGFPNGWYGKDLTLNPVANSPWVGDVIKFELPLGHQLAGFLNGTIWTLTTPAVSTNGQHVFGCHTYKTQHYTQCLEYNTIDITSTVNYYDNFLNFVNKFCADCNISILNNS